MSKWFISYEHWDKAGHDSTRMSVGPFDTKDEAEGWAESAWVEDYDPRWYPSLLREPWAGVMQNSGAIEGREAECSD